MMFRSAALSVAVILPMLVKAAAATEPHLRINFVDGDDDAQSPELVQVQGDVVAVDLHPKAEFSFEKGFHCKGAADPMKGGAGKRCEATMKRSVSLGLGPVELASDIASNMEDMYQDLMPDQEGFFPLEEDLMELTAMDDYDVNIDEMDDDIFKTVKFGGFLKVEWDCTVTLKKEGALKISKMVECGAKAVQGTQSDPHRDDAEKEPF